MEKNSFNLMAPFLWNQLDNDCKDSASISIFKNCIFNYILGFCTIFTIYKQDF